MRTLKSDDAKTSISYSSIAVVHSKIEDYDQAPKLYLIVFTIWKQALGEDHPNISQCLSNIAGIYQMLGKYSDALECLEKALVIYQKHLPTNHPQLGDLHSNIGTVHEKCLPSQHPDIAMTLTNIGLLHESKGEWQQALSHFEKASATYHHVLYPDHPTVTKVERFIERVSAKSNMA